MNRKAVLSSILALTVFMALLAIIPFALAEKTDGQWVTATEHTTGPGPTIPGEVMITNSGVIQYRNFSTVHHGVLTIGGTSYPIYGVGTWHASFNPDTKVIVRHDDTVWYISAYGSPNGFAGNIEAKGLNFNPVTRTFSNVAEHCLLQGFGGFAGQTLMLSYEGPPPGPNDSWTGFALIR